MLLGDISARSFGLCIRATYTVSNIVSFKGVILRKRSLTNSSAGQAATGDGSAWLCPLKNMRQILGHTHLPHVKL